MLGLGFNGGGGGGAFFPITETLEFAAGGVYGGGAAENELEAAPGGGGGAFLPARELIVELADGARRMELPGDKVPEPPEAWRLACSILATWTISKCEAGHQRITYQLMPCVW